MRVFILLLASLALTAQAYLNYSNPGSGDLNTGTCAAVPNGVPYMESPIWIQNSTCGNYDSFQISMTDIQGVPYEDSSRGSFIIDYDGAKLQVDNTSYTSTILTFRYQSEHLLPYGRGALEMQIEMNNDVAGGTPAVLSFLVQDIGDNTTDIRTREQYRIYNNYKVIQNLDRSGWNLNLSQVGTQMMSKGPQAQFLNIYTYPGTFTYSPCSPATWFVSGDELYAPTSTINVFRDLVLTATSFTPGTFPNVNSRPFNGTGGGSYNSTAQRLCYSGYFSVTIGQSYGIWFGVATIVIFFIVTLTLGEKPVKDPRYHENVWTHHPIYSIRFVGNDLHTRKSRAALILMMISLNAMCSSIWYNRLGHKQRGTNIILYAVFSSLISFFVVFVIGNVLRWYYQAKYEFHQSNDEAWDQTAQNRIFGFYTIIFFVLMGSWGVTVWMMNGLHANPTASNFWVASLFVGLALELLVYYPLECVLAGAIGGFRDLIKRRGFMYDDLCHQTYLAYVKSQ